MPSFSRNLCNVTVNGFEPNLCEVECDRRGVRVVPVNPPNGSRTDWKMFGGAYAASCDSRWRKAIRDALASRDGGRTADAYSAALPMHDRIERQERGRDAR